MAKLEEDKPKLNITSEDAQICEAFAVTVFNRADKQDRAGHADMNTVKAFYVATVFIDVRTPLILMQSRAECQSLTFIDNSCFWRRRIMQTKAHLSEMHMWHVDRPWQMHVILPACVNDIMSGPN